MSPALRSALSSSLGTLPSGAWRSVAGGHSHVTYLWGPWFLKISPLPHHSALAAEVTGLQSIAETSTLRVPAVLGCGIADDLAWLALEALDLHLHGDERALGERLAALHQTTGRCYGDHPDNFIGSTPQRNLNTEIWADFFRDQRLLPLIEQLRARGHGLPEADPYLDRLPDRLPPRPPASRLHGDLWSGNKAFMADGSPVVFDPAVYHGDPECDIAMTRLFGGFGPSFYQAYRHHHPAPAEVSLIHDTYHLYHLLNHALLFGGNYLHQARDHLRRGS
ncbi:fructosamine-3-kinase [Haloferula luteola]|uniref:Fructosamine-3-kinase n=1 Tax=Haloferula luteola TaxID=595692 RepID=A0A840VBL3_9BACT|nr:fructosamine kinase family protein [Haloferula luteola]MBB5352068.1 fructosamine-3-kinase [Haloferula luteola]